MVTLRSAPSPLMPATNQARPWRRASTASLPGSPSKKRVSSQAAGTVLRKLRACSGSPW
jgi:hypothetical protein